jgi:hypothetical protein
MTKKEEWRITIYKENNISYRHFVFIGKHNNSRCIVKKCILFADTWAN